MCLVEPTDPSSLPSPSLCRVDNNSLHQAEASSSTYTEQDNMAPQRRNLHVSKAADAPVVPFGMDLYYWDKPKDLEPMTLAP